MKILALFFIVPVLLINNAPIQHTNKVVQFDIFAQNFTGFGNWLKEDCLGCPEQFCEINRMLPGVSSDINESAAPLKVWGYGIKVTFFIEFSAGLNCLNRIGRIDDDE